MFLVWRTDEKSMTLSYQGKLTFPERQLYLKACMIFLVMGHVRPAQQNSVVLYCCKAEGGFCDEVRLTRFVRFSLFFLSTFMCLSIIVSGRSSLPRPCNIGILYLFGNLADCERLFDKKIWLWFVLEFYHWVIRPWVWSLVCEYMYIAGS